MELYAFPFAPNPMKPIILIGEKALDVKITLIDRSNYASFQRISPTARTPVLVLEDGRVITESLTICQYLDEVSGGDRFFGDDIDERVEISMWERRAELEFFNECAKVYHNLHPMFRQSVPQSPEAASSAFKRAAYFLATLGARLENADFVAGPRLSAADITAFIGFFWLTAMGVLDVSELSPGVRNWGDRLSARRGFAPLLSMADVLKIKSFQAT